MKTIIDLFHPDFGHSRVNKALFNAVKNDFDVCLMYDLYADFQIDVSQEQQALAEADRIVIQFPMQWYSTPALLKQWEDAVLTHGWAYGSQGNALHGKQLLIATTVGANNYGRGGSVKYTVNELLRPLQATSHLIGMDYLKPFVVMGASSIKESDLQKEAGRYLKYLHDDRIPVLGDFE